MNKKIGSIIENHISIHKNTYLGLIIIYVFTMIAGAFCVSFLSTDDLNFLHSFFEEFIDVYKVNKVDFGILFQNVFLINLRYLLIMFISGFIVVGMPFLVLVFCCKVFYIGFAFGTILKIYGFSGFLIGINNVFLQNFLTVPLFLVFCVISLSFSKSLFLLLRKKQRLSKHSNSFEKNAVFYIIQFVSFAGFLAVINVVETFLVVTFI